MTTTDWREAFRWDRQRATETRTRAVRAWARGAARRSSVAARSLAGRAYELGWTIAALACIVVGCALVSPVLGWVSAGLCILLTEKRVKWEAGDEARRR